MGRFRCNNDGYPKGGWSSNKVIILLRGDPENRYNSVAFNQRCQACNGLGILTLDENSYVEQVAYRIKQ